MRQVGQEGWKEEGVDGKKRKKGRKEGRKEGGQEIRRDRVSDSACLLGYIGYIEYIGYIGYIGYTGYIGYIYPIHIHHLHCSLHLHSHPPSIAASVASIRYDRGPSPRSV